MESFFIALNAVVPYVIYIGFGYFTRLFGVVNEAFMKKWNGMIFKCFIPLMMFRNLYGIEFDPGHDGLFLLFCFCALGILLAVSCVLVPRFVKDRRRIPVVIQALYRSNFALFGLSLAEQLYGQTGAALASIAFTVAIPYFNVGGVVLLEHYRGTGRTGAGKLIRGILSNPLIQGSAVGVLFTLLHITLPECIMKPVDTIGGSTTALALFVLGGTLHFSAIRKNLTCIAVTSLIKLILYPALIVSILAGTSFSSPQRAVIFILFASPVAAASYPMSEAMGADGELAGQFVVISTVLSVFTIFLWIFFMNYTGFLA